ncbi:unnamed protein product [Lactuca virosa]|uniref:Uncharacterized protein n=1 Tax=Lactuca virosa TaxID=75947 RepID=A0AAU9PW72_9ASTR|nr:unnamed protein product [Lactuca virosa]
MNERSYWIPRWNTVYGIKTQTLHRKNQIPRLYKYPHRRSLINTATLTALFSFRFSTLNKPLKEKLSTFYGL